MVASGETWKQFKILELLGRGGMGEVFLAEDSTLGRKVALKVLAETLKQDSIARERLLREARSAAALDHPYICKIYEIGEAEGHNFVAMEYVEGQTLQEKLTKGPLPLDQLLQLGAEIAEAVEAAHQKNLVHRDLKTPNIMVTRDQHIKVMDFGLATQIVMEEGRESGVPTFSGKLTGHGSTPGTVVYMSPEQVRGEPLDARSDVFSLGVVLYEMATGEVPFRGATSGLTYDAILNRGSTPPSKLNRQLPVELEQIIDKALEKDRENRYQSAKEILVDLRRLKRDTQSGPTPASGEPSLTGPAEAKRKTPWVVAAAATLVALVLAVVSFWPSTTPSGGEAIDSLAVLPFENTRNDPEVDYLTDGIAETLINRLSQLPQLRVMARSTAFRYRGADIDPQQVGSELGVGAVLTGRVVHEGGTLNVQAELVDVANGTQLWGEQYSRPLTDIFDLQNNIATEITHALRLEMTGDDEAVLVTVDTSNTAAYQAYLRGRYLWFKRTNEDFKRAILNFQEALAEDPDYALAHAGLADSYLLLAAQFYGVDEDFPPVEGVERARAAAQEAIRLDPTLAEPQATMAFIRFINDWDWEGAENDFKEAIALNPSYATAHHWYALYLSAMGRHDEALEHAGRAADLEPTSAVMMRTVGRTLFFAGQYEQAIQQLEKTLELNPSFPLTEGYLAGAYWLDGIPQRAIATAESFDPRIAELYRLVSESNTQEARERLASSPGDYDRPRGRLAWHYAIVGENDRAITVLEELYRERHPQLPTTLANPLLYQLRTDPRFVDLYSRLGLPTPNAPQ